MRGAEKLPIPRMTARAAGKLSDKLRRQTMIARQARKNQIAVIVPGPGGLAYAKAPRYAGNRPGRQRGLLYNRQGPTLHGVPNQWTRAPKDVVARTELSRVEKIMVRDHGLKLMYDPPEISLSEAVRVTPLVSAALAAGNSELAASYLPAGVTAGYTTGRGSAQNPSWRGSSRILGTGANYIPAPPQTGFNKPSFEEIASGQSDYFGSGRGSLGEATSLTPSIVNWRKTQSDKLKDYFGSGKGSLGEAVYLTPDIVKGNPFLLGKYQPNNFGGGSGGGSGGGGEVFTGGPGVPLSPGLTGGIADGLNAGSAGGSGAGGLGGGSSIGLNFGSLPTVALLALAAFLVLKR